MKMLLSLCEGGVLKVSPNIFGYGNSMYQRCGYGQTLECGYKVMIVVLSML